MRILILIITIVSFTIVSCKSTKNTTATVAPAEQGPPNTTGKISHQYKDTGCGTVVLVNTADGLMTLIPKDKLPDNIDKDGVEITFDYRLLKMPNPKGCKIGMPAELTNVNIKKK